MHVLYAFLGVFAADVSFISSEMMNIHCILEFFLFK